MTIPNQPVDQLYSIITLIQDPINSGHATGFFFVDSDGGLFLITNHHVIRPEDHPDLDGENPDNIRILIRSSNDLTNLEYHDVSLYDQDKNKNWQEHPMGSDVDVVAIPLEIDLSQKGNMALSKDMFLPDDVIIPAGEEALIIGYPFKGQSPYIPVIRNALISSPYGTPFQNTPTFATDANMHSGTSGSPVFLSTNKLQKENGNMEMYPGRKNYIIGIHSSTLHSDHPEKEGPLNINVSWYIELLDEIL